MGEYRGGARVALDSRFRDLLVAVLRMLPFMFPPIVRVVAPGLALLLLLAVPVRAAEDVLPGDQPASAVQAPAVIAATQRGATLRIGTLDLTRIARESKYVDARMSGTQDEMRGLASQVELKVQELRRGQEALERQRTLLEPTQIEARTAELRRQRDELEELQFKARRLARETENSIIEPVLRDIMDLARAHAEREGYDIVLRADVVIFSSSRADMTTSLIAELDSRVGPDGKLLEPIATPAPAASATPSPAKAN